MAGPFVINFFFKSTSYGWSETWYKNGEGLDDPILINQTRALRIARRALLPVTVSLFATRISDVNVLRDSYFEEYAASDAAGTFFDGTPAPPFEALVLRLENLPLTHRRMFLMRGIPEEVSNAVGDYVPLPSWTTRLNAWRSALVKDGIFLMRLQAAGPISQVVSIGGVGAGTHAPTFNIAPAIPGLAANNIIKVTKCPYPKGINGTWKVLNPTDTTAVSVYPRNALITDGIKGSPMVRTIATSYTVIYYAAPLRVVRRSTGRPSYAPRGRRRLAL